MPESKNVHYLDGENLNSGTDQAPDCRDLHDIQMGTVISIDVMREKRDNARIWDEILSGNYANVSKITALNGKTARHLVLTFIGPILNIPNLKTLPVPIARQLARWPHITLFLPNVVDAPQESIDILRNSDIRHVRVGKVNVR